MENEIGIIYDLVFAYENKDNDLPHDFELKALHRAYKFVSCRLGEEDKVSKFILSVFEDQSKKAGYNPKKYDSGWFNPTQENANKVLKELSEFHNNYEGWIYGK